MYNAKFWQVTGIFIHCWWETAWLIVVTSLFLSQKQNDKLKRLTYLPGH